MHTLIVQFTPRQGSNTAQLLAHARSQIRGTQEVLDLAEQPPAFLDTLRVNAYVKRNYAGQALSAEEQAGMAQLDAFTEQVKKADVVILAAPMHNFSLPGAVKAWFDGIIQKGQTWTAGPDGYRGLMQGKKALSLFTANGVYEGEGNWDVFTPLARILFQFMGFSEVEVISAQGLGKDATTSLARARAELDARLQGWYATA
jgi:FMN-dependent NADH-azoreductase